MKTIPIIITTHLLGELYECPNLLSNSFSEKILHLSLSKLIKKYYFRELGSFFYTFPSKGITGIIALAESHVAIHTWPETNYVTLDVFICNYKLNNIKRAKKLFKAIVNLFASKKVVIHEINK